MQHKERMRQVTHFAVEGTGTNVPDWRSRAANGWPTNGPPADWTTGQNVIKSVTSRISSVGRS